jgi:hypothetical protein
MVAGQLLAPDDTRLRLAGCRQGILTAEELLALRQTHLTRITAKQHGAAFHRQNDRVALGLFAARSEACVVRSDGFDRGRSLSIFAAPRKLTRFKRREAHSLFDRFIGAGEKGWRSRAP